MKLYEISNQYQEAFTNLSEMDDMPEEAIKDTLEALEGEFKDKGLAVAAFFQNLDAEVDAIKSAEKRMSERRKAIESKVQGLKDYLKTEMERTGITEISCPEYSLKIKKNPPSVIVEDINKLPCEFVKEKVTYSPDKAAIKKAGGCEGAYIQHGTRLEIK